MSSRKVPSPPESGARSWMDLLAQSTFPNSKTVQAEVFADVPEIKELRLVVQSYEAGSDKPIGSLQRAVSAFDLRIGLRVCLVELAPSRKTRVVAWVEPGRPDLEFDARTARPSAGCFYGEASGSDVHLVLSVQARAA